MPIEVSSLLIVITIAILIIGGISFADLFSFAPSTIKIPDQRALIDDIIDNNLSKPPKTTLATKNNRLEEFYRNIRSGGVPKDGIPPIDKPKYVSVSEGNKFLKDRDIVFGINYKDVKKAFPQKIIVWHEIVNDVVSGEKISVTYCPLTGTSIGYKGKSLIDNLQLYFGTSGNLVSSNLVMYDRQTDSLWPQILGTAINGKDKGNDLEWFPVHWTTWGQWKKKYPDTLVLSEDTGFLRSYGNDPYGSYDKDNTYYQTGEPFFPVMAKSDKLPVKKIIIGVKLNNSYLAIPKDVVKQKGNIETQLSGKIIIASYDYDLDTVTVIEKETGNLVTSFDAMWFAWYAFYPNTGLYSR